MTNAKLNPKSGCQISRRNYSKRDAIKQLNDRASLRHSGLGIWHSPCREGGFTLIELIVVIAIIGILVGAAAYSFRTSEQPVDLERVANAVLNDLRDMQSRALAGEQCPLASCPTPDPSGPTNVPQGGYGIQFWAIPPTLDELYVTFADYQIGACGVYGRGDTFSGEAIKTYTYNQFSTSGDLKVENLEVETDTGPVSGLALLHIIFKPADGTILINGTLDLQCTTYIDGGNVAKIKLRRGTAGCNEQGQCLCIIVNVSGEMYIDKNYNC